MRHYYNAMSQGLFWLPTEFTEWTLKLQSKRKGSFQTHTVEQLLYQQNSATSDYTPLSMARTRPRFLSSLITIL